MLVDLQCYVDAGADDNLQVVTLNNALDYRANGLGLGLGLRVRYSPLVR